MFLVNLFTSFTVFILLFILLTTNPSLSHLTAFITLGWRITTYLSYFVPHAQLDSLKPYIPLRP